MLVDFEHRIIVIGGRYADITERPFQVLLTIESSWGQTYLLCGGALLNSRWVLTAAQLLLITTYLQLLGFLFILNNSP